MKIIYIFSFSLMIIIGSCTVRHQANEESLDTDKMLEYCVEKVKISIADLSSSDSIPRNIYPNQTNWNKVGIHDWTSGFWPGILWYAYEVSGDDAILKSAEKYTESLQGVIEVPVDNHDLGFMLYCSYGNGLRLEKDPKYHDLLLLAADSLATLYNPKVGTILSWPSMREEMDWPHNTIIDNMINLELLFWASKNGGSPELYDIAVNHANKCMETLVRTDYSTYHVAVFDTVDGHFIKGVTHQGYADDSQWARGQAWAIYGYAMSYNETGDENYLQTAQLVADVFLKRLPPDGIPYWDFDDPNIPNTPKDASAAAVAASGMLELSNHMTDTKLQSKYRDAAIDLITKLSTPEYLSGDKNKAFLLHSTGHMPNGTEIDASIIYADYYYIEALLRLKKIEETRNENTAGL